MDARGQRPEWHLHCAVAGALVRCSFRSVGSDALIRDLLDHCGPVALVGTWRRLSGQAGLREALERQGVAYVPLDGGVALAAGDLTALLPAAGLRWADAPAWPEPGAPIDPLLATPGAAGGLPPGSRLLFALEAGGYGELLTDRPPAARAALAGLLRGVVLAEFPDAPWQRPPAAALAALLTWAEGSGCRLEQMEAVPGPDGFLVMVFAGGRGRPRLRLLWRPGAHSWRVGPVP